MSILDRALGPDAPPPYPYVGRRQWWCRGCGIVDGLPVKVDQPECEVCGGTMAPYRCAMDDPTRAPAPHWRP